VVAVASPSVATAAARRRGLGWTGGAAIVLVVGLGLRLALGGSGVGDRSAVVMATVLTVGAWLAARLVGGPRTAFLVSIGVMALHDIAALPERGAPEYDGMEGWYRIDQVVSAQLAVPNAATPSLTLLVQPVFTGAQPSFGLAADVNGVPLSWTCPFERDIQRLALPIPREALGGASSIDVRLHLTGSPSREADYLILYTSSRRGGPLLSLASAPVAGEAVTSCSAQ
jgi:hypothetical protein